jgi:serine/threonine protein kinase
VHLDVKPDNFRITKKNVVKILDFGLMNEYRPNDVHRDIGKYGFQGTPYCGSINALKGFTLSRRDDIESLGYALMFIINS